MPATASWALTVRIEHSLTNRRCRSEEIEDRREGQGEAQPDQDQGRDEPVPEVDLFASQPEVEQDPRHHKGDDREADLAGQRPDPGADAEVLVELEKGVEVDTDGALDRRARLVEDDADTHDERGNAGRQERRDDGTVWFGVGLQGGHSNLLQATGAAFVMKAPNRPAAPAAAKERMKKTITAFRISSRRTNWTP